MKRRWFILTSCALFLLGIWVLGADVRDLIPSKGGRELAVEFASAAFRPALGFQSETLSASGLSFWGKVFSALWLTVRYAVVAMSLALVIGVVGGVLGARSWWARPSFFLESLRRLVRLLATGLRSVHELMWALLFISAVGTSPLAAVLALALPYGGTLAKVFSELLDEANPSAANAFRLTGGSGIAAFWGGVVTTALPDLITYALYRLECAVRSSAVLGFVGIPTIGYQIATAFEDGHLREIWTYLYALLIVVWAFEWWGSKVRELLAHGRSSKASGLLGESAASLFRKRPRSGFLRATGFLVVGLTAAGWLSERDWNSGVSWEKRWSNLQRFGTELIPFPVRENGDWSTLGSWLYDLLVWEGLDALWRTFHLGTAAILLGATAALGSILWAARTLATDKPRGIRVGKGRWRMAFGWLLRIAAVLGRGMPEFILAFLLLQIFGPTVWALIFALAIHNGGILLRLGAEVIDNSGSRAAEVMLAQGGGRGAVYWGALFPASFSRLVLFLFYRWETCIREATMLGMLGVGSLGFLISEAGVRFYYDEMLLWVVLGGGLVFIGDLSSDWVRKRLRDGEVVA